MGSMSLIHWLVVLTVLACFTLAFVWPAVRILQRAGFSPWWVLICLVPGGPFVGFLLLAFVPWPSLEASRTEA
jgi:hypothetical protein